MHCTHAYPLPTPDVSGASVQRPVSSGASDIRTALARGEFELWFQPEIRLTDGKVVAVEALARWRHPARGILLPAEFLPQTLERGLGVAFTRYVMSSCVASLDILDVAGYIDVAVAMNVSWDWIADRRNVMEFIRLIEHAGHRSTRIIVEITESAPLIHSAETLRNLHLLREHGFVLALDDFGAGYNSIEHLRYMPLDYVKVDRSLVERSSSELRGTRLLRGIVTMVHGIGLAVTVEGISRDDDLNLVLSLNADLGQGNLFAEAMPITQLVSWLSTSGAALIRWVSENRS